MINKNAVIILTIILSFFSCNSHSKSEIHFKTLKPSIILNNDLALLDFEIEVPEETEIIENNGAYLDLKLIDSSLNEDLLTLGSMEVRNVVFDIFSDTLNKEDLDSLVTDNIKTIDSLKDKAFQNLIYKMQDKFLKESFFSIVSSLSRRNDVSILEKKFNDSIMFPSKLNYQSPFYGIHYKIDYKDSSAYYTLIITSVINDKNPKKSIFVAYQNNSLDNLKIKDRIQKSLLFSSISSLTFPDSTRKSLRYLEGALFSVTPCALNTLSTFNLGQEECDQIKNNYITSFIKNADTLTVLVGSKNQLSKINFEISKDTLIFDLIPKENSKMYPDIFTYKEFTLTGFKNKDKYFYKIYKHKEGNTDRNKSFKSKGILNKTIVNKN